MNQFEIKIEVLTTSNQVFTTFVSITDRYSILQTHVIEILTFALKGNLHPYVIGTDELIEEIIKIKTNLPYGVDLPFKPSYENLNKMLNIVNVNVFYSKKRLNFLLTMPLVNLLNYKIFKITSVPRHVKDNIFETLVPDGNFLVIDEDKQNYFLLDLTELKECINLGKGSYICKQVKPVHISHGGDSCERDMFENNSRIPNTCTPRLLVLNSTIYLELAKINSWIFVTHSSENVLLRCDNHAEQTILRGIGKLEIRENCQLRSSKLILNTNSDLYGKIVIKIFFNTVQKSQENIKDYHLKILNNKNKNVNITVFGIKHQLDNLKEISYDINKINKNIDPIKKIEKHEVHLLSLSFVTCTLVVTFLVLLIYKIVRKCRCKKNYDIENGTASYEEVTEEQPKTKSINKQESSIPLSLRQIQNK